MRIMHTGSRCNARGAMPLAILAFYIAFDDHCRVLVRVVYFDGYWFSLDISGVANPDRL